MRDFNHGLHTRREGSLFAFLTVQYSTVQSLCCKRAIEHQPSKPSAMIHATAAITCLDFTESPRANPIVSLVVQCAQSRHIQRISSGINPWDEMIDHTFLW